MGRGRSGRGYTSGRSSSSSSRGTGRGRGGSTTPSSPLTPSSQPPPTPSSQPPPTLSSQPPPISIPIDGSDNLATGTPISSAGAGSSSGQGVGLRRPITIQNDGLVPSEHCSRRIRKIFEERICSTGSSWKRVSADLKEFYWNEFKKYFVWEEAIDALVKIAWGKKAATRYSDMLQQVKGGERPFFVPEDVWTGWQRDWSVPEYVRRAQQNAANRRQGATHTGGSVTHATHASRMRDELGREVTPYELFQYTHTMGHDRQTFVDDRARRVHETIEATRQSLSQHETGSSSSHPINEREIYYQAVGGEKKNRVYGVGSQASAFYPSTSGSSTQFPTSEMQDGHMQQRMEELRQEIREEMREEMGQELRQVRQEMEEIRRARQEMEEMQQQMRAYFNMPRDPTPSPPNAEGPTGGS